MARRLPSSPPILAGFTHVHALGSGGFADVFLYEQNMPRRKVAVKVLLSEVVDDQVRRMFQAEANLMAQLSAHPSILTVYQASVSSDGRPYLVMEFCSAGLNERYRRERIPVTEVLRIAVKIGSAIQSAHCVGVLHRDIKPSNILLTAYGHPVLSDFGIASTRGDQGHRDAVGLSVPWSAPEVLLDETQGTVASEVWSFAATVYSLLAGRSPFELPGESNSPAELIARIGRARVDPIGRPDIPATLERALQRAMSRKPENRPASVLEFVHELQAIETELGATQTPVEVAMDEWAMSSPSDPDDLTQIRASAGSVAPSRSARRRARRASGAPSTSPSVLRTATGTARRAGARTSRQVRLLAGGLVLASVVAVALGATMTLSLVKTSSTTIPTVTDIQASIAGDTVEFAWPDPGLLPEDLYSIRSSAADPSVQDGTTFTVAASSGDRVCLLVNVTRAGKIGPPSVEKCIDVPA
ncbi:MAG: protein kinase [Burkholderiaceae bacterium]|nr:protein kinase [Microbacteriaceae bacterium]